MLLGFQKNFTPDDLFCKVIPIGEDLYEGAGASVQFNGDICTADEAGEVVLTHPGRVTVTSAVSRADLINAIRRVAPDADSALGGLDPAHGWPLRLGDTANVSALPDRLFIYGYAVEQAKRSMRNESSLPAVPFGVVAKRDSAAKHAVGGTWIFQANPNTFDLDGYLRVASVITWTVRQRHFADRITVGDRVFIWRAQGGGKEQAGVIAAGYILEPPQVQPEHEAARSFWREPPEQGTGFSAGNP